MGEPTGFGWNKAIQQIYGPAPKEEVMDDYQFDLAIADDAAEHERNHVF